MPVTRASTSAVLDTIRQGLLDDATAAAHGAVLSKAEAATLDSALLQDADERQRWLEPKNGRVTPKEVVDKAMETVERNLKAVNQATGSGAATISQEEIKRLQGVDAETAQRAAKAYQLITGKRVVLDGQVPASPPSALPDAVRVKLLDELVDYRGLARAARVDISNVQQKNGGYAFDVKCNVFTGKLFAREVNGALLLASKEFGPADVDLAKRTALAYFDSDFKPDMESWGATAQEIADARAQWLPERILLDGEDDPDGLAQSYPLVFQIKNESGSDHGIYCGVNSATGDAECYAFN